MPPVHFLALLEGLARENPEASEQLDAIYAEATAEPVDPEEAAREAREARRQEIDRVLRAFG